MGILKKFRNKRESRYLSENKRYSQFDIGRWSYGWPTIWFEESGAKLTIGNYCSLAKETTIMLGGEHDLKAGTTYPFDQIFEHCMIKNQSLTSLSKGDVRIGSDVWICHGAYIGSGINIGHGAVVAAMAVVTRDVEPFSIVGGNPAKHIRYRFDKETRERILNLAWWDWPHEKVIKAWPYLKEFDINKLESMNGESN